MPTQPTYNKITKTNDKDRVTAIGMNDDGNVYQ